jgi:TolB protein
MVLDACYGNRMIIRSVIAFAVGACFSAAVSAQQTLAFSSFAPVNSDVFIADGTGRGARALAPHPDLDQNASLSSDGDWVVFTSWRGGSADIWRVRTDGTGLERLIDDPAFDDQAALAPDGRKLAFVSSRGGQVDLWLLDLETNSLARITDDAVGDFRPAWSPDGEWLAFSSEQGEPGGLEGFGVPVRSIDIHVIRPDGTQRRRVTDSPDYAGSPSWTTDGRELVFYRAPPAEVARTGSPLRRTGTGSYSLAAATLADGSVRIILAGEGEKWTPRALAADRVGYASRDGLEFTSGAAGERGDFRAPYWSSDARTVVFHRDVDGAAWPPHRRVPSRDARFDLVRTGIFPSWSPDGTRLAVNDARAGGLKNSILVSRADGSERRTIYTHPEHNALAPIWSPRGERLAFALGGFFQMLPFMPRASADIAIVDSDGSNMQRLTDGAGNFAFPSWSPDGTRLVYRSFAPPGLHVMDVESRESTLLLAGPHNFPSWSPRGDRIAFVSKRDDDFEIYTIRPDGSGLTRSTSSPGVEGHLAWSADGEWLAFASDRAGFRDERPLQVANGQPAGDIWVMRADGSELVQLTDDQYEEATPAWRP